MIIKEFRIIIPMTVDEYQVGQLYTIQKKSRIESVGHGSGVEIIENKPYENNNERGQYTLKVFHVDERLPAALKTVTKLLFPKSALSFEEESWNSYPYTRTKYKHGLFKSFNIDIESKYLPDLGQTENAFNLNKSELAIRTIDYIDIVNDVININEYKADEDPSIFQSVHTKRGPLNISWIDELKASSAAPAQTQNKKITYMCVYKLCRIECAFWGCQSRVEKLISESVLRHTILITHRQAWCWQDEYTNLTIDDVRRLEAETQRILSMKMKSDSKLILDNNISGTAITSNNNNDDDPLSKSEPFIISDLKLSKSNLSSYSSCTTIDNISAIATAAANSAKPSTSLLNIQNTKISKSVKSQIKSNFVSKISFDNINTEDYFEYNEESKKDPLEFNLNILNNPEELDVDSQNSNIDEFYDAISQASFSLSTNIAESVSSSSVSRTDSIRSKNNLHLNTLNKAKPVLNLKSTSTNQLLDTEVLVHKSSSNASLRNDVSPNRQLISHHHQYHSKIETLILVVHGGNVTCTDTSKTSDFLHFKSTMESLIKLHYNTCSDLIAYRLISCEPICKEALITLSNLSPITNEAAPISGSNFAAAAAAVEEAQSSAEAFSLNENMPFNTIPLLIAADQKKYQKSLDNFIRECNKIYNEFINSTEGFMFQGQVVLIGDSIGSLFVYDALCLNTNVFSQFDESSSTTSSSQNCTLSGNNNNNKEQRTMNSNSPSPSPTLNRNPLISINDMNAEFIQETPTTPNSPLAPASPQLTTASNNNHHQRCNSSLSNNSSGLEYASTTFLTPPSPTLTPTLAKNLSNNDLIRLDFEAAHFFVFGSPLGLVLAWRKLANKSLDLPACTQIYNFFHLTDPVAIRIEPLLCKQFRFIQPCMIPRYSKFPMGDGSNYSLDHFVVKYGHLFDTNNFLIANDDYMKNSYNHLKSLHKIIQTKKEWWGENRIDYVLYAPEKLSNLPRNSLPYLFHSCFWESNDVVAFILRMIFKNESELQLSIADAALILKNPSEPVEKWQKKFNRMKLRNLSSNHRANDVIVLEDKPQILTAKFSYGPLDFALSGEKIDIYISSNHNNSNINNSQKAGDYQFYSSVLTDSHGKIKYELNTEKRLPLGIYQIKMVVRCDHTYVEFYMVVLPVNTETVVFSIDGSFAANISFSGTDPKVRAGAVDVVRHWQDLGYLILYITARPDMQHYKVTNWLAQHNFPIGMVFFSDGLRRDPIKQKAETLKNLVTNCSLSLQAGYGSAKDIPMYANLGVNSNRIFITGKTKTKYLNQAIVLKDGYASHLTMLQNPNNGSRQALGNARLILKKSTFNIWHNQISINLNSQISTQVSSESFLNDSMNSNHSTLNHLSLQSSHDNNSPQLSKLYGLQASRSKN